MKRYKFKLRGYDVRIKPRHYFPDEIWIKIGKSYGPFFKTYDEGFLVAKEYNFDYLRMAHEFIDVYEAVLEVSRRMQRQHRDGIKKLERYIEESEGGENK